MIKLKINAATNRDYNSRVLTARYMKLKLKIPMTILVRVEKCLILVIILLTQKIMMNQAH